MLTSGLNGVAGATRELKAANKREQRRARERRVCDTRAAFLPAPPDCSAEELRSVIARNVMAWIGSGGPGAGVKKSAHEHFEGGTGYGGKRRRR
jgi:hypothetical protein